MERENGLKRRVGFLKAGMLLAGIMACNLHAAIMVMPEEMARKNECKPSDAKNRQYLSRFSG
jgi:hypothetical protein